MKLPRLVTHFAAYFFPIFDETIMRNSRSPPINKSRAYTTEFTMDKSLERGLLESFENVSTNKPG